MGHPLTVDDNPLIKCADLGEIIHLKDAKECDYCHQMFCAECVWEIDAGVYCCEDCEYFYGQLQEK